MPLFLINLRSCFRFILSTFHGPDFEPVHIQQTFPHWFYVSSPMLQVAHSACRNIWVLNLQLAHQLDAAALTDLFIVVTTLHD